MKTDWIHLFLTAAVAACMAYMSTHVQSNRVMMQKIIRNDTLQTRTIDLIVESLEQANADVPPLQIDRHEKDDGSPSEGPGVPEVQQSGMQEAVPPPGG